MNRSPTAAEGITGENSGQAGLPQRAPSSITPHEPKWFQWLGARLLWSAEHALATTLKVEWEDSTGLFVPGTRPEPVIFCAWHNRLALAMRMYSVHPLKHQPQRRMAALVSASKDGAFLSAILQCFGVQPVRGSSSRRGSQALIELTSWAEQGYDLAITPDGPRGPRYVVQPGVIALAQLTGLPIVPVSCHIRRKWTLKTWDSFQIPQPLTRCDVRAGEVMRVPRQTSPEERQSLRAELETRLRAITKD